MGRGTKRLVGIGYIQLALTHCTNIYETPTTDREKEVPVDESVTVLRLSLPTQSHHQLQELAICPRRFKKTVGKAKFTGWDMG